MPEPARHKEIGKLVQFHLVDERLSGFIETLIPLSRGVSFDSLFSVLCATLKESLIGSPSHISG